jgi:putative protein-disulfide isomerase
MDALHCDLETGLCTPAPLKAPLVPLAVPDGVVYVGDPMCSWCWGLSPALDSLRARATDLGLPFTPVVGGLRPGGGDAWTPSFRGFLRQHWEEVHERTGQPFSFELLSREQFTYDTEPACRAVVVARAELEVRGQASRTWEFFAALQRAFYVEGRDLAEVANYEPLCRAFGLDFDAFKASFESPAARQRTFEEFNVVRAWGVHGFPTVLFKRAGKLTSLARGYATAEELVRALGRATS